ncbi:MAG: ABC transporter ATP-binding protein [Gemmatimonadales bacterium]|jgi:putative ABC transport system ATP-binding protein
MSDPVVRIEDVSKVYGGDRLRVEVLSGMNLEVAGGDFVALMGPSGSGKTTLLNLIAAVDRPTSGRVIVAGQDTSQLNESALAPWRHRHIGYIFQLYNLIPVLTAYENVELPLTLSRLSSADRRAKVETALEVVSLTDRQDHYPRELSGGQEQRVAIARAIVTDPTVLLADEPTGDLDAESAEGVLRLMERLNTEFSKTIIMVTHDPRAASHAHRFLHLDKGKLWSDPEEVATNAGGEAPSPGEEE